MKLKSFTIIEVLIATAIFVCVVALSAASYGMVIKSNTSAKEASSNFQCLSNFEDAISTRIKSSARQPFIVPVRRIQTRLTFDKFENKFPESDTANGFVYFEKDSVKMIFASGQGLYELDISDTDLQKGFIDTENIEKKIVNIIPPECRIDPKIKIYKSQTKDDYLIEFGGQIKSEQNKNSLQIVLSVAVGEGI